MEYAAGEASLSKVGLKVCNNSCVPKYYTVRLMSYIKRTFSKELKGYGTGGYLGTQTETAIGEYYESSITMDKFLNQDNSQREDCVGGNPKQTSQGAGGTVSYQTTSTSSYGGNSSCSSTRQNGGPWSDNNCNSSVDAVWMTYFTGVSYVTKDTCNFVGYTYPYPHVNNDLTNYYTLDYDRTEDEGDLYINEFTTGQLKSELDSRSAARIPSFFLMDKAVSYRFINGTEDCAAAAETKFRIRISSYTPRTQYLITWHVLKIHRDGSWEHKIKKVKKRSPSTGDWFYPGPSGGLVERPVWPSGACTQGGSEIVIYFNPAVSIVD